MSLTKGIKQFCLYYSSKQTERPIRVLVSKLGLDGHDRGAFIICKALRDAGMEVIYSGLFCTPEQVAKIAIDEDVDVVAMSLLNGAHLRLFPRVKSLLEEKGANNIVGIGGGIIPQNDKKILERQGIKGNFGPGTTLEQIIEFIRPRQDRKFCHDKFPSILKLGNSRICILAMLIYAYNTRLGARSREAGILIFYIFKLK